MQLSLGEILQISILDRICSLSGQLAMGKCMHACEGNIRASIVTSPFDEKVEVLEKKSLESALVASIVSLLSVIFHIPILAS